MPYHLKIDGYPLCTPIVPTPQTNVGGSSSDKPLHTVPAGTSMQQTAIGLIWTIFAPQRGISSEAKLFLWNPGD
jgi:hypothetical protein